MKLALFMFLIHILGLIMAISLLQVSHKKKKKSHYLQIYFIVFGFSGNQTYDLDVASVILSFRESLMYACSLALKMLCREFVKAFLSKWKNICLIKIV